MTVHKRIQNDFDLGGIEIQIDFDVDNGMVKVSNIHIHSTFDSGLPSSPTFEQYGNKHFLVAHYPKDDKKMFERIVGNIYADQITEQIVELIKEITETEKK